MAFLANVNCRISRASGGFDHWAPISALPWNRGSKCPSEPQLQGTMTVGHCMSCLWHNIYTSCDLQTTDSGKIENIWMLMGKRREKGGGNHQKLRENSGKMMLKILYEPWIMVVPQCNQNRFNNRNSDNFLRSGWSHTLIVSTDCP